MQRDASTTVATCLHLLLLRVAVRLSRQKPMLEASPENSSEDLVANDLSENDIADDDDDDVDRCDS